MHGLGLGDSEMEIRRAGLPPVLLPGLRFSAFSFIRGLGLGLNM